MFALNRLADTFGWCYVVCWGVSLYPPIRLNYRTKSVEGISVDFVWLNFCGTFLYLFSVLLLFYSKVVRAEYSKRNPAEHGHSPSVPLVHFNDVFYGIHSFVLIVLLMIQVYCLGYKKRRIQRVSKTVKLLFAAGICGIMTVICAPSLSNPKFSIELLDIATVFGSVKVLLSAVKYIPQAVYNYSRRSVKGFAISSCIIDIVGSVCCICQLFLDSYISEDIQSGLKHPTKLLLSLVTVFFNVIFLAQAAVYNRDSNHEKSV